MSQAVSGPGLHFEMGMALRPEGSSEKVLALISDGWRGRIATMSGAIGE